MWKGIEYAQAVDTVYQGMRAWSEGETLGAVLQFASAASSVLQAHLACFSGDTPLLTPDGSRRIDEIKVGDYVLSRDEHALDGLVAPRVEHAFDAEGRA